MKAKEMGKWLLGDLLWGTGFYLFSIGGIYLAVEWGRSPLFARRATVLGYVLYMLITIIIVLLVGMGAAGKERKPPGRSLATKTLIWAGITIPVSSAAFALSALCLYAAGLILGAKMPTLGFGNWLGAWAIMLALSLLKVMFTIWMSGIPSQERPG
ncbi:MAG: hypothetical protein ABIM74_00350 [candidate division WOR-3 bacterium]